MSALSLRALSKAAGSFIAIGGRLMLDPEGNFRSAIDMARLFERTWPIPDDPAPFEHRRKVARKYDAAERGNEGRLASLVAAKGTHTPNGWLVWEAA